MSHGPYTPCDPIQCILPPHMVESMRMRGDKKMQKMCDMLEKHGEKFRAERMKMAPPQAFLGVAAVATGVKPKPNREVYDAQNRNSLPGKLARDEKSKASKDKAVNDAFNGAGDTFKLYLDNYGRNSLDGNGLTMVSTVHYSRNYNNAFWNGRQMVYGDGDGVIFKPLSGDRSVIGHELSHGVVQFSGGLVYREQSGALNESFADVFGALTVQYKKKQSPCDADWLIGADILGPNINGVALRSMRAPGTAYSDPVLGTDPQPYHMDLYVHTASDNGGVHINSGIPNHAFYLLANYLKSSAWEKAGKIWYDTMQAINNPLATFNDWANKTVDIARGLHGAGSLEVTFTRRAWKLVGIDV